MMNLWQQHKTNFLSGLKNTWLIQALPFILTGQVMAKGHRIPFPTIAKLGYLELVWLVLAEQKGNKTLLL